MGRRLRLGTFACALALALGSGTTAHAQTACGGLLQPPCAQPTPTPSPTPEPGVTPIPTPTPDPGPTAKELDAAVRPKLKQIINRAYAADSHATAVARTIPRKPATELTAAQYRRIIAALKAGQKGFRDGAAAVGKLTGGSAKIKRGLKDLKTFYGGVVAFYDILIDDWRTARGGGFAASTTRRLRANYKRYEPIRKRAGKELNLMIKTG